MTETWAIPQEFVNIKGSGEIAVDCETRDPRLKTHGPGYCFKDGGEVIGVSVTTEHFTGYYPFAHTEGNLDKGAVIRYLQDQLNGDDHKIFHNAGYDLGWLGKEKVDVKGQVYCTQAAAALIDENRFSYTLDSVGKDYCGFQKQEDLLTEKGLEYLGLPKSKKKELKGMLHLLPSWMVGPYAEGDTALTFALWQKQKELIKADDLWKVMHLEMELIPVLIAMRNNGVRVDLERAHQLMKQFQKQEADAVAQIKHISGYAVDPWAAETLIHALETEGIKCPRTPKTGAPSIQAKWLEQRVAEGSKIAPLILAARRAQKTHSTFIQNSILDHEVDGRVHAQFHALKKSSDDDSNTSGTISGRFSSTDPNLQQLPIRDEEIGPLIRACWLPEEGEEWGAADYSQQEPRLTVHFAAGQNLKGAWDAVERYTNDPSTDYHSFVAELAGIGRKPAKTINLGLAYGMGGPKLCHSLGLPTKWIEVDDWSKTPELVKDPETGVMTRIYPQKKLEVAGDEGQAILDAYNAGVPFISELQAMCKRRAKARGYLRTLEGRRCRFPMGKDGKRWFLHAAMNRLIQGSAADQTKRAMVAMHKAGIRILVTVHDELGLSLRNREEGERAKYIMENVIQLRVPSKVDLEIGPSWGEAK